jgi:hypothetical protein
VAVLSNICEALLLVSVAALIFFIVKKNKGLRNLFIGLTVFFFILTGVFSTNQTKSTASSKVQTQATIKDKKVLPSFSKQKSEDPKSKLNFVYQESNTVYDQFSQVILNLSNGSDPAEASNQLDEINTNALNVFSDANSLNVPKQYQDDQDTLKVTISDLQNSISELKNYLNDHKTSEMASAESDLKQAKSGLKILKDKGYKTSSN